MAKPFFFFFFLTFLSLSTSQPSPSPDLEPLMSLKAASDPLNHLSDWNKTTNLCTWRGVSCRQNRVSHLVLEGLSLTGTIKPLTSLTQLRVLSLKHNHFSGPVPDLSNLTALKHLFLSHNDFSGEFPPSLPSLYRLDLSHNNFTGEIPADIVRLTHLLTLRLEENSFSGRISDFQFASLQDFNVSENQFTGEIPKSLSGFPRTAFLGNPVLCGAPLEKCKSIVSDPSRPGGSITSPSTPTVISSSPSSKPGGVSSSSSSSPVKKSPNPRHNGGGKVSVLAVVAIIIGDVLVLSLISGLLFYYFWRKVAGKSNKNSRLLETEKIVYSSSPYAGQGGGFERGKMVFFQGIKRFELEDLLRASAEMLGKGGFGTAYKAVLDDGNVVAVKRLKDVQVGVKREFEQHMEFLGRLRHTNVVSLKAFYLARDEKLLIYEYTPNGSLFWLLHGNRGPGRTPLDWATRLKIAEGVARGIAFIHHFSRSPRLSHGNIKSTNVLIDRAGNPCVSDYGLSIFASPTIYIRSNGYRAPEASDGAKFSHQKADVYSFGVLLLEILTGKCPMLMDENGGQESSSSIDLPRWVQSVVREEWTAEVFDLELMGCRGIEEEMVGLLQIAISCTCVPPDQRPKVSQVVKMIEELRGVGEEFSPSQESSFDSLSDSPSFSEER